jgi:hypothetical protein
MWLYQLLFMYEKYILMYNIITLCKHKIKIKLSPQQGVETCRVVRCQ